MKHLCRLLAISAALLPGALVVAPTAQAQQVWDWSHGHPAHGDPPGSDFSCGNWVPILKCQAEYALANHFGGFGYAIRSATAQKMNERWWSSNPTLDWTYFQNWQGTNATWRMSDGSVIAWINVKQMYTKRYCRWGVRVLGSGWNTYISDQVTFGDCAEY